MNAFVSLQNVTKKYGSFPALNNLTLEIPSGRITGILGPNGSGKTTLFKLLTGLLTPNSGEIRIGGLPIGPETKSMVSYLPDRNYFTGSDTPLELFRFFRAFYKDFSMEKALQMTETLKINPKAKTKTLSKGMQEKLQLILVMSREASLYCLDEPLAGVDPASRDFILRTILTNFNPDAALLISTHLIQDIEGILDDFVFLNHGIVERHQSVEETRLQTSSSIDTLFREVYKC